MKKARKKMALSLGAKIGIALAVVGVAGVAIAGVAMAKSGEPEEKKEGEGEKEGGGEANGEKAPGEGEGDPIYKFCQDRGGKIMTRDEDGLPPLCVFPDGREVDAWQYLRGEAKPELPKPEGPLRPPEPQTGGRPDEVKDTDVVLISGDSVYVDPDEYDIERIWVKLPYEAWGDFEARSSPWPGGKKTANPGAASVVEQVGEGDPGKPDSALWVRWAFSKNGQAWLYHRELNSGEEAIVSVDTTPRGERAGFDLGS